MIDEDDTIVQPNWNAYATDTFRDFTGIDSEAQLDAHPPLGASTATR